MRILRPVKRKTLKIQERHLAYVYVRCKGYTAIRRRGRGDIWQGLWEPVVFDDLSPLTAHLSPLKKNVKHVLTHRILYADFYLWEVEERPSLPDGYIWIREADIQDYGVPRLIEIMLNEINA